MAFGKYKGQCVGRLMYFLYSYTYDSDRWQMGDGKVHAYGKQIATYTWDEDGDSDYPTFVFTGQYEWLNKEQELKKEQLIKDQETDNFMRKGREKWSKKAESNRVKKEKLQRHINLYKQIVGTEPPKDKIDKWKEEVEKEVGNRGW